MEEDEKDEEEKEEEGADPANPKTKKGGRQRSRKKNMHKKFSTNFISLIIKFLVVVTVLEGYFLLCFLETKSFLTTANSLILEAGAVT